MKRHILVCHEIRCPYCATKLISTAATICTHLSNHHQFESSAAEEEAKRMVFLDVYPFFVCFYFQLQTLNKRRLTVMAEKENMETEQPAVDFNERFAGIHLVYRHQAIGKQDVRNITNKLNQEQPIIRGFGYAAKTLLPNPCIKRLRTKIKKTTTSGNTK